MPLLVSLAVCAYDVFRRPLLPLQLQSNEQLRATVAFLIGER
jgi:hypothetical protein